MPWNLAQLDRHLRDAKGLATAYLIAGEEHLLVLEAADRVRARAKALGFSERQVLDAESGFDWDELARAGASLSLFASQRLIDLRLPGGKPGNEGSEAIQQFCESAPPDTCLLVTCTTWGKAHEGKWVQAIERAGGYLPIWPLRREDLDGWIAERSRSRGLQLTPEAVAAIAERVEGNLLAAAQEIDKLRLLVPDGSIDAPTVVRVMADSARYDVFSLVDAALLGDGARVVRILRGLKAEGEMVPGLMGWFMNQLQAMVRLSQLPPAQQAGAMPQERIFGPRQQVVRKALARTDRGFWEQRLREAAEVDRLGKGRGTGDPYLAFERLLLRIADRRKFGAL